ncbi:MAG TPA: AlkA N-terminal domain-containing protein [Solirubrobacteraceae bacterium]|jgi:AraC family transcriptional regulator of adaptative response / DNA-3-methyladenine glycosylase II
MATDAAIAPDAPEFEARYRVLGSRDRRFDGCFFVAVTSTGIYCRPSCPAIVPKRRNVRFYPTAAAAQGAGFRACLRCHPHAAPGSPEWNARGDLAARAMGLISDGVVDREGVAGLAQRLAYSERHLTRQLTAELGAGPLALARAQRSQTARMLIQTSELRLIDVAYAAGFSSVRQFNDTIRAAYGRTPTELRQRPPGYARNGAARTSPAEPEGRSIPTPNGASENGSGTITVRLSYREPLDWEWLLGFLAARAVAGVEEVRDEVYRRTLRLPRGHGVVELSVPAVRGREQPHVRCALQLADLRDLSAAVQRCRRLLDLDADPAAPAELLARDPLLGPLVNAAPGLRVPGAADGAELAVRAVLGQQVSVAAARTAAGRLVQAFGEPLLAPDGGLTHLFPAPAAIAEADPAELAAARAVGPAGRRASLQALARALADGDIAIDPGSDRDEVRARLLELPGIGPWTERYIAMRGLCDPDAFLPSDIGVLRALQGLGVSSAGPAARVRVRGHAGARTREAAHTRRPTPSEAAQYAERWRPWRAYALQYLWASLG